MSSKPPQSDRAFSETADPSAYVPRDATERALSGLERWSRAGREGPSLAALIAPPGLGKTFLLRLLESRLNGPSATRALYLPYAGLLLPDLCQWVHGLLGRPMPDVVRGESGNEEALASAALVALMDLAQGDDERFFLLLDDADSMPPGTLRALLEGVPREASRLRLLLALNPDARSSRLLAALDAFGTLEVRLDAPMSEAETSSYVRARMRWAGVEADAVDSLDAEALRRIHALSGGVPRQVHRVAQSHLEAVAAGRPSDLDAKLRREDWMGQPIDDDL